MSTSRRSGKPFGLSHSQLVLPNNLGLLPLRVAPLSCKQKATVEVKSVIKKGFGLQASGFRLRASGFGFRLRSFGCGSLEWTGAEAWSLKPEA